MKFKALLTSLFALAVSSSASTPPDSGSSPAIDYLNLKLQGITGDTTSLAAFKGSVILLVNVASECGYTPQYEGLQALYERLKARGLVVIGVPANEFGAQEPGSNAEILKFCESNYNVTFPLMAKIVVKGDGIHPLYKYLTEQSPFPGEIKWNFNKFLLDRSGAVRGRFLHKVKPDDPELVAEIERLLAETPAAH